MFLLVWRSWCWDLQKTLVITVTSRSCCHCTHRAVWFGVNSCFGCGHWVIASWFPFVNRCFNDTARVQLLYCLFFNRFPAAAYVDQCLDSTLKSSWCFSSRESSRKTFFLHDTILLNLYESSFPCFGNNLPGIFTQNIAVIKSVQLKRNAQIWHIIHE